MEAPNMANFDPQKFLDATVDQPSIRRPPLPTENPASPDGLYMAVIGEPKARPWTGRQDPTKSGVAMDIPLLIDVPGQLQDQYKIQAQVQLTDSILLDLTPEGQMDNAPGKNRKLRIYRDATNLNKPGDVFSFRKLQGQPVKVRITHEQYEGDTLDKVATVLKV